MGERDNIGLKLEQIFTSWYSWPDTINCTYICYATALWHCIEFSTFKDQLGTRAIKIWYAVFCSTKAMNSTVLYELNCFNGNFLLLKLTQHKTKKILLSLLFTLDASKNCLFCNLFTVLIALWVRNFTWHCINNCN